MAPQPKRGFATPPDVIAFFRDKRLKPSFSYLDVWGQEHATAFTVAKAVDAELLGVFKQSIDGAIARGESFETWRDQVVPMLQKAGWGGPRTVADPTGAWKPKEVDFTAPRRLKTIFWSNMRAARAAGQWERMQRTKKALPYILYERTVSLDPRPEHLQWVGLVLPVDHPFWRTHFPPNGWGCKCAVRAVSAREAERLRGTGRHLFEAPDIRTRPFVNKRTGEIVQVPDGLDPAWAHNPGLDRARALVENLKGRLQEAGPALARRPAREFMADSAAHGYLGLDATLMEQIRRARKTPPVK